MGDLNSIAHQIARRVSRYLEEAGYLVRDAESAHLDLHTDEDDAMANIIGACIHSSCLAGQPGSLSENRLTYCGQV